MVEKRAAVSRQREVTQSVAVTRKAAGGEEREIKNEVKKIPAGHITEVKNPAYLRMEHSATKNMQNYESVRVAVALEMPCLPEEKEIKKTADFISKRIETLMMDEMEFVQRGDYLSI